MPRAKRQSPQHVDKVTITIQGDSLVEVELDAFEVDDHLRQVGELRAEMRPQHAETINDGERVSTVFNPSWVCDTEKILAHSVLHIRDPRYGWLHYVIPRDIGTKLAAALTTGDDQHQPTSH